MRTIEEEAKFIFGDLETGEGAERRRTWLWGAKSKQVEAEKIKAKIEQLNQLRTHFDDGVGFETFESYMEPLQKQLKEIENE